MCLDCSRLHGSNVQRSLKLIRKTCGDWWERRRRPLPDPARPIPWPCFRDVPTTRSTSSKGCNSRSVFEGCQKDVFLKKRLDLLSSRIFFSTQLSNQEMVHSGFRFILYWSVMLSTRRIFPHIRNYWFYRKCKWRTEMSHCEPLFQVKLRILHKSLLGEAEKIKKENKNHLKRKTFRGACLLAVGESFFKITTSLLWKRPHLYS